MRIRPIVEIVSYILSFIFDKLWTLRLIYKKIEPIKQPRSKSCEKVKAIIFNHCEIGFRPTNGSEKDVESLMSAMASMNFNVDVQPVRDWKTINYETQKMIDNADSYDCLMIVVLTEGLREENRYYDRVTELVNRMAAVKCSDLVEKPKIVILQLRNDDVNKMATDSYREDNFMGNEENLKRENDKKEEISGMPLFANFFILLSSFLSKEVERYDNNGSPLVTEMVKQLEKHGDKDLYDIFMSVFKEIGGLPCYKRSPHYVSTLTQRVCFKKVDDIPNIPQ